MPKKILELEQETVNELLKVLRGIAKQGEMAVAIANRQGLELPDDVAQMVTKLRSLYRAVKQANANVEIKELEALFALDYEGEDN